MSKPTIEQLMQLCIEDGASDIHISVGSKPIIRKNTHLVTVDTDVLDQSDTEGFMKAITPERIQTEYMETGSGDFSLRYSDQARFRVALFKEKGNCTLVLRRIPTKILKLSDIGLPDAILEICGRARGLFLVTGPTGSGKTTTLASIIDHINCTSDKHILTFEDPIEYFHEHKMSLVHQREIGVDVPDFPEALRRGLRQDPDVILVGEMRDLETIRAAVTAAETGHLVFATLHTSGAASTVNRVIDAFPADEQEHIRVQLAGSLVAVLSQVLCSRANGNGMVAAYEFLHVTSSVQNMIRNNKPFSIDSDIQTGSKFGMQLLDDHLFKLVQGGHIEPTTAVEKSRNPREMIERLGLS